MWSAIPSSCFFCALSCKEQKKRSNQQHFFLVLFCVVKSLTMSNLWSCSSPLRMCLEASPTPQCQSLHILDWHWGVGLQPFFTLDIKVSHQPTTHFPCVVLRSQVAHNEQSLVMLITVTKASGGLSNSPVPFLTHKGMALGGWTSAVLCFCHKKSDQKTHFCKCFSLFHCCCCCSLSLL